MAAKIFPDSANIWQDQAKVLFNYYRQCAERVVAEEERIEREINDQEEEKRRLQADLSGHWWLMLLLVFPYFIYKSKIEKQLAAADEQIGELKQKHAAIFRDYHVDKLGVVYVPVAEQVKYQDKSFIVDYTGSVPDSRIAMSMSRQNELLVDTIRHLDALSKEAPVVETSEQAETIQTDDQISIPEAMDVMIRWFCILFGNQFTPDEVLDYYPVDRLMHDIALALMAVQTQTTGVLDEFPTRAAQTDMTAPA